MSEHDHAAAPTPADPGASPATTNAPTRPATTAHKEPKRAPAHERDFTLVRRGWFGWEAPATVGATTLGIACVLAVVFVQQASRGTSAPRMTTLDAILWTLLGGPSFILLGVVALWIGAWSGRLRLGDKRLACARMAGVVGVAMLTWALGPFVIRFAPLEWLASTLVYVGALWLSVRPGRRELLAIAGSHLLLCAALVGVVVFLLPRVFA